MVLQRKEIRFTIQLGSRNHKLLKMHAASRGISMQWIINSAIEKLLDEEGIDLSENNPMRIAQSQRNMFEGVRT